MKEYIPFFIVWYPKIRLLEGKTVPTSDADAEIFEDLRTEMDWQILGFPGAQSPQIYFGCDISRKSFKFEDKYPLHLVMSTRLGLASI